MTFYSLEAAQREMPIGMRSTHWATITETRYAHNKTDFELLKKIYDSVEPKTREKFIPHILLVSSTLKLKIIRQTVIFMMVQHGIL